MLSVCPHLHLPLPLEDSPPICRGAEEARGLSAAASRLTWSNLGVCVCECVFACVCRELCRGVCGVCSCMCGVCSSMWGICEGCVELCVGCVRGVYVWCACSS